MHYRLGLLFAAGLALNLIRPAAASAPGPTIVPALDFSTQQQVPLKLVQAPLAKSVELASSKSHPFQFAVAAPLTATLADGLWDHVDAGTSRWRLRVSSPGAESLNFEFSRFHLPAGAALWIYDAQGELIQGPYTSENETPEGKLWTAVVLGEQAVLEVRVPEGSRDQLDLELGSINHGFRGFGKASASDPGSGSCNVDVVCPAGDAWRSDIRSVARISIGGKFLCSGQMVNNTQQNNDPLFITANHCEVGQTASTPASSLVFYWNYFNSTCRDHSGSVNRVGDGTLSQTQSGSTLLAGDVNSDFTLVRLNQAPPSSFNVYFAGWNATSNTPHSGVAIHHPHGYEKSISVFSSDATAVHTGDISEPGDPVQPRNVDGWDVKWTQGTTEQGSSGGGLWDQRNRIVGWLSAGNAGCGAPADDGNINGDDVFGRMDVAWNTQCDSGRQLQAHLAPNNNNVLSLCGRDQAGASCDNSTAAIAPRKCGETQTRGGGSLGGAMLLPLALLAALRRRVSARRAYLA